jgi:hypothetical protein
MNAVSVQRGDTRWRRHTSFNPVEREENTSLLADEIGAEVAAVEWNTALLTVVLWKNRLS